MFMKAICLSVYYHVAVLLAALCGWAAHWVSFIFGVIDFRKSKLKIDDTDQGHRLAGWA